MDTPELFQILTLIANGVLIPLGAWMARSVAATNERLARIEEQLTSGAKTHGRHDGELEKIRDRLAVVEREVERLKILIGSQD